MKKYILLAVVLATAMLPANAQLKVASNGNVMVGNGTMATPQSALSVGGVG